MVCLVLAFLVGYLLITLEHPLKLNKTASALVTGGVCWTLYELGQSDKEHVLRQLGEQLSSTAAVAVFILCAMTIVELIDAHDGFEVITSRINTRSKRTLFWIIGVVTFFMSSVLDNLTTTIVMVTLARRLLSEREDRLRFAGMIVIAANAGGAWTPIGDVTTTMLWIGNRITTVGIIKVLLVPSLLCLLVPLIGMSFTFHGTLAARTEDPIRAARARVGSWEKHLVLFLGFGTFIAVPLFKAVTHLPPYLGILLGLGLLWMITERLHVAKSEEHRKHLGVMHLLQRVDMSAVLFFVGILLAVGALEAAGVLAAFASWMELHIHPFGTQAFAEANMSVIVILIGVISAIVDNVPLVAATMGMYNAPTDTFLWEFIAYCAGTGGSMLIIGSAAGVAAMSLEKITFFWYLRRIAPWAMLGYVAGALAYIGQYWLMHGR